MVSLRNLLLMMSIAITGRVGLSYYSGVATQIRDMINRKGHKLQVVK
jgi:nucleoside-triphosphatase THEP1